MRGRAINVNGSATFRDLVLGVSVLGGLFVAGLGATVAGNEISWLARNCRINLTKEAKKD